MSIDRDRIALIKRLHMGIGDKPKKIAIVKPKQEKRQYVIKNPRKKMSIEERLIRRRECLRDRVAKFKEGGLCQKCGQETVMIRYLISETVLLEEKMAFCVKHNKSERIRKLANPIQG